MTGTAPSSHSAATAPGPDTQPRTPPAAPAPPAPPVPPVPPTAPAKEQGRVDAYIRTAVPVSLRCGERTHQATLTTFHNLMDAREHLAVLLGRPRTSVPLVRLHSECLTGDVFGSERCDCGAQLDESLAQIATVGGVLLYLRQEGRGIGLYNKLDAYRLQDRGLDTYAANRALGLEADARDYTAAAQMLLALGHREIDLLTNNPDKRHQLERNGISVRCMVPTMVHLTAQNSAYLKAKATITAHTLSLEGLHK
ncbi:GTP cyclohydrolase II [Streptomyces sp. MST-110588]|uniref:GTP cyclohydrolase II n=1 Tax=Streptomyces sp. MST-110588 TaxID=2833628 RepID=UPI001F5DEBAE|nr:GTP cyclohydrolase II [Streptomyces sp. MST-110588]UNO38720.1 GTP cyclohydrolase II [Streptomyces sp. MST-110588]